MRGRNHSQANGAGPDLAPEHIAQSSVFASFPADGDLGAGSLVDRVWLARAEEAFEAGGWPEVHERVAEVPAGARSRRVGGVGVLGEHVSEDLSLTAVDQRLEEEGVLLHEGLGLDLEQLHGLETGEERFHQVVVVGEVLAKQFRTGKALAVSWTDVLAIVVGYHHAVLVGSSFPFFGLGPGAALIVPSECSTDAASSLRVGQDG